MEPSAPGIEPKGCPTPGACSCIARALDATPVLEAEGERDETVRASHLPSAGICGRSTPPSSAQEAEPGSATALSPERNPGGGSRPQSTPDEAGSRDFDAGYQAAVFAMHEPVGRLADLALARPPSPPTEVEAWREKWGRLFVTWPRKQSSAMTDLLAAVTALVDAAVAQERERCAEIATNYVPRPHTLAVFCDGIADAIRQAPRP